MDIKRQARSGVKWTGISSAANIVIQTIRTIVLARLLSPEDFGLMGMVMVVVGFVSAYTDLGISAALIHRQDASRAQLSSLYWLNIITGIIGFIVLWVSIPLIIEIFKDIRLIPILKVLALTVLIDATSKQFEVLLQKDLQFKVITRLEIITPFIGLMVATSCAIYGLGVWSLVWGLLSDICVKSACYFYIGMKKYRPSFHFRSSDLKGYLTFGLYQMGERLVNYMSERFDQILIGSVIGAQALGYYNFAFNLVMQPVYRVNPVITRVSFPVFSRIQNEIQRLRNGYIKVINILTSINAPLLIGLAVTAPLIIPLVFGDKWNESIILVQILSIVALFKSIGNPIGSLQLAKGRADLGFKWNIILLFFSIPVIYMGGLWDGSRGVAIALFIFQLCTIVPGYFLMIRPLIGKCAKEYYISIMKPLGMSLIMAALIIPLPYLCRSCSDYVLIIIMIPMGCICYLLLLWYFDRKVITEFRDLIATRSVA